MNINGDGDGFFDWDADYEQAEIEEAGRAYARGRKRMLALRAVGRLAEAAQACRHGGGYPLASDAARNSRDPHVGEAGWRCDDCGSRLTVHPWDDGAVAVPCEIPGRADRGAS